MRKTLSYIKQISLFVVMLFAVLSFQNQYDTNAKIKSLFIYNFAKYIEWPSSYKQGDFIIGILGDHPVYKELNNMAQTKKVFDQPIQVIKFSNVNEIQKCHMLIIPRQMTSKISQSKAKIQPYNTLLVTEKIGVGKSSDINFVISENKQKFELNQNNLAKKDLKVSNNLVSLAIAVK